MTGPGQYLPDATEGITRVEDLPQPRKVRRSRSYPRRRCPHCGHSAYRNRTHTRTLHDLGESPRTAFGENRQGLSGVALSVEMDPLLKKVRRKRKRFPRG